MNTGVINIDPQPAPGRGVNEAGHGYLTIVFGGAEVATQWRIDDDRNWTQVKSKRASNPMKIRKSSGNLMLHFKGAGLHPKDKEITIFDVKTTTVTITYT